MEKLNLAAIANTVHIELRKKERAEAAVYVEETILPWLRRSAERGSYKLRMKLSPVYNPEAIKSELLLRANCRVKVRRRSITVRW